MAIQYKIPYVTTIAAAEASFEGIEAVRTHNLVPQSLQEYQKETIEAEGHIP